MRFSVDKPTELKKFLTDKIGISSTKAKKLLDQKNVWVNNQRIWIAGYKLRRGDIVEVHSFAQRENLSIIYQENSFLVINKPAGLLTNGKHSAESILRKNYPSIEAVHRLDKDTSGLVIFALTPEVKQKFIELFRQGKVKKIYRGIAIGQIKQKEQRIAKPIAGQIAVTRLKVLKTNPLASYIELQIPTGRKHQIRLHLNMIGHPLVGEKKYHADIVLDQRLRRIPRQMLHAYSLSFPHPESGEEIFLKAPEPKDFLKSLEILKLQKILK